MKLKKIASLALAGVMAASMLAGCNTGNSNSNSTPNQGGTETVPTSAVVNVFNSKQNVTYPVKVEFAGDTELEKNLQEAVEMAGVGATASTVLSYYKAITGEPSEYKILLSAEAENSGINNLFAKYNVNKTTKWSGLGFYDANYNAPVIANVKDGTSNTWMLLVAVDAAANSIQSPTAAVNSIFSQLNSSIFSKLDAEYYTSSTHTPDMDYLTFSYAGTAGAVTGMAADGKPIYYIAMTLTQTTSVETTPSF